MDDEADNIKHKCTFRTDTLCPLSSLHYLEQSREDVSGGDTNGASKNSVKSVRAEVEERNKDTLKPVE